MPTTVPQLEARDDAFAVIEASTNALRTFILGVGTATTPESYSQPDLLKHFGITDPRITSLFLNSAIDRRHLTLPNIRRGEPWAPETQGVLLKKHKTNALEIGSEAIRRSLRESGASTSDISFLCCVTTTGFLSPGLSALLCRELGLTAHCARLDVVGMGCNAGLNALNVSSAWTLANPGRLAVVLCVEICSAAYVFDLTMRTAVVNSLFGDGAASLAIAATSKEPPGCRPAVIKFCSNIITEAAEAMRYDWDDKHNSFSFFLDPTIPYVVGAGVEKTVDSLLSGTDLRRSDISHWIVHSGGKKVIDAIKVNLGLSQHDLRHTSSVLRDYGNVSSGSFLFSYERLLREGHAVRGDHGVMITMGPGCSIESAILRW